SWSVSVESFGVRPFVSAHLKGWPNAVFQFGRAWPSKVPKWLPARGVLGETDVLGVCDVDTQTEYAFATLFFKSNKSTKLVVETLERHLSSVGVSTKVQPTYLTAYLQGRMNLDLVWVPSADGRDTEYHLTLTGVPKTLPVPAIRNYHFQK